MNFSSEQCSSSTPAVQAFHFPALTGTNLECERQLSSGDTRPTGADPQVSEDQFNRGVREGLHRSELLVKESIDSERQRIVDCLHTFEQQKKDYFGDVEREVVKLACSIARRVLHREAQVDQQLLLKLVRSALQDIKSATRIRIYVNPALAKEWSAAFVPQAQVSLEIIQDEDLPLNRSRIETDLGATDIGWDVQLAEVERGLFDLLEKRPGRVQ